MRQKSNAQITATATRANTFTTSATAFTFSPREGVSKIVGCEGGGGGGRGGDRSRDSALPFVWVTWRRLIKNILGFLLLNVFFLRQNPALLDSFFWRNEKNKRVSIVRRLPKLHPAPSWREIPRHHDANLSRESRPTKTISQLVVEKQFTHTFDKRMPFPSPFLVIVHECFIQMFFLLSSRLFISPRPGNMFLHYAHSHLYWYLLKKPWTATHN